MKVQVPSPMLKDKHLDFQDERTYKHMTTFAKRATRRHHMTRLKNKRKHYWGNWFWLEKLEGVTRQLGKLLHTPKLCSCWMCGNPRKKLKEKTVKEISQEEFDKKV